MKFHWLLALVVLVLIVAVVAFLADTFSSQPGSPTARRAAASPAVLVRNWPGDADSSAIDVALDGEGNIYVIGNYAGQADSKAAEATEGEFNAAVYLTRLSPTGETQWTRTWTGSPQAVMTDNNGNVYVTGFFEGTVDFDPGPQRQARGSTAGNMVFLVKYDPPGQFQWVKAWGDVRLDRIARIAIDDLNKICVAGLFTMPLYVTEALEQGLGEESARHKVSLHKFDSSGNMEWMFTGSAFDLGLLLGLGVDGGGNAYLLACHHGETDTESPASGCSCGEAFVTKFGIDGEQLWTGPLPRTEGRMCHAELTVGDSDNIYVAGDTIGDSGSSQNAQEAGADNQGGRPGAFVAALDPSGSSLWIKSWGGAEMIRVTGIATGADKGVYVTGFYSGSMVPDGGRGEARTLTSRGSGPDSYLVILDSDGVPGEAYAWGGDGGEYAYGLAVQVQGAAFVTGDYHGTVEADFVQLAGLTPKDGAYVVKVVRRGG